MIESFLFIFSLPFPSLASLAVVSMLTFSKSSSFYRHHHPPSSSFSLSLAIVVIPMPSQRGMPNPERFAKQITMFNSFTT